MSVPYSQKDPLGSDVWKEVQTSDIHFTDGRCSPPKLCSHAAVTRRSRRQFTCVTQDLDDQSSSIWRFLSWVAYSRTLAGRSQITDDERLRCPLIWCRCVLGDQNMLLEHVFTCAHLSDGRYWCFHCQKEERFAPFQCKHCQVPAFRKDRLSTRAKRIFRWLGTKSHLKDHQAFNQSAPLNGTPCTFRNQCFEYLPEYRDISPTATEMEDHQVLRDLGADDKSGLAELNGSSVLPAELSGYSASTSKLHDSSLGSKDLRYPTNDEGGASVPYYASLDAIQAHALPTPSFDIREPLSQFPFKSSKPGASEDSLMQLLSPVSPQNADRISASYADTMSESPTDTDFSGMSSFTKSFDSNISPPSTRNSTMQSFSQSSLTAERPSECLSTLPIMHDIMNEMPSDMPEEDFYCAELASGIPGDAFPSAERQVSIHIGSPHWLTSKDLLNNLWKVLTLHVKESSERLSTLPDSPVISHLLSMTADTIASTGFSVWQGTLNGCLPATIPDLYALVHVAYACAIVIYDGQVENQVRRLFTHSLSIDSGALPDEDKSTYTNIVWSIWSPGSEDVHLHPFTSAKHNSRPIRPPNGPPWVKGKAPLHLVGVSELVTQSSHMQESVGTMESHSHRGNEILNVLAHFLDIFEGTTLGREVPSTARNPSYGSRDEIFIRTIKENVTIPLMKGYFQATPSLEAFIKAVLEIERLVNIGHITTIRELEVGLIWAGRSTARSIKLYKIFSNRVKELCSNLYHQLRQDPALQNESHHEGVNAMWINLKMVIFEGRHTNLGEEHWHQSGIGPDSSSSISEQGSSLLDGNMDISTVDGPSQSHKMQAELCRRPAIKRKRSSSSSTPDTGSSPSSISSNTLSESSESEYNRCLLCDFRPTGERRWHKRTIRRHMQTHLEQDQKEKHLCSYKGCDSSFTRADNLAQHVRVVHQRNKR